MKYYAIYRTKLNKNLMFFQSVDNWTDSDYLYWQKIREVENEQELLPKKVENELYYFRPVLKNLPLTKRLVNELKTKRDIFLGWSSNFREPVERILSEKGINEINVAAVDKCFISQNNKKWMIFLKGDNGQGHYACAVNRKTLTWQDIYAIFVSWGVKKTISKHTRECPRCNGRGIMKEFMHIAKGICFLCFGNKII